MRYLRGPYLGSYDCNIFVNFSPDGSWLRQKPVVRLPSADEEPRRWMAARALCLFRTWSWRITQHNPACEAVFVSILYLMIRPAMVHPAVAIASLYLCNDCFFCSELPFF